MNRRSLDTEGQLHIKFTAILVACLRPRQAQARPNPSPSMKSGSGHEIPLLAKDLIGKC